MGKITDALTFRATAQTAIATLKQPSQWVTDWFGQGDNTASGEMVTPENAHKHAAYWACINVLSQTVASLPFNTYTKKDGGGRELAEKHPLFSILKTAPNPEMSSFNWRQTGMGHLLSWGNFYCKVDYTRGGKVVALWPLRPDRMTVKRVGSKIMYEYQRGDSENDRVVYSSEDIFHIPGYGFDGLIGYSPTRMAMESIGWSQATVKFGARFFGNRSTPSGVLTHPQNVSEPAAKRMKSRVESSLTGENQNRLLVLEEGLTWQQIGIPQNEAQFIETMSFQVEDMCRWFNVPPSLIHHLARATFTNVEHMDLSYTKHSVRPWLVRWEQEIDRQLISKAEMGRTFTKLVVDGLLRGDTSTRNQAYATGRQWGWLSANDIREMEDKNPIENGDVYLVPVNMQDVNAPAEQAEEPDKDTDDPAGSIDKNEQGAPGDDNTVPGGRGVTHTRESRALKGKLRRDLRESGSGFFEEVAGRLARREAKAMRKAHKLLGERDAQSFTDWLVTFFKDVQQPTVERDLKNVFKSYAGQIRAAAISELGYNVDIDPAAFSELIDELARAASFRWVGSSNKGIQKVIEDHIDDGGMVEALESRLNQWETGYPVSVGLNEATRAGGAVAALVFGTAGARLVWSAGNAECALCAELDGRVVGREEPFLKEGEELNPPDVPDHLRAREPVLFPPVHRGCDCLVVPEDDGEEITE